MKKSILILSLVLGLTIGATAQEGSGLFKRGDAQEESNGLGNRGDGTKGPGLPDHGENTDQPAPLGSGALLLIGFGAAYAMSKKNKH